MLSTLFILCLVQRPCLYKGRPWVWNCLLAVQVLYLDADTLWLDDPLGWWSHFEQMNVQGALFGMAEEDRYRGFYKDKEAETGDIAQSRFLPPRHMDTNNSHILERCIWRKTKSSC